MTLLRVEGLTKTYAGARSVRALDDVSLTIAAGETLGLVGPSGSGKSTLARVIARLITPDQGRIAFDGQDWLALRGAGLRKARAGLQMVFQDPAAAFHPRATLGGAIADALRLHSGLPRRSWPGQVAQLLASVELDPDLAARSIRHISGGQRQRVALARALATRPKLVILDEAVAALDASVRLRILKLLTRIQRETGVACLFVSHDLAVVRAIAHRIAVMQDGRIVETGPARQVIAAPQSDLTRRLIAAIPTLTAPGIPDA